MGKSHEFCLQGQKLIFHPERAIFWQEKKALIVADPHFGKAQVLREHGIPVPKGTTAGDLERLSGLLDLFHAHRLIVLGDLTHGRVQNSQAFDGYFKQWRRRYKDVKISLVTGNHDRHSGRPPTHMQIDQMAAALLLTPFHFTHRPTSAGPLYTMAGHLHPAVTLKGKGRQKEILACFWIGSCAAVLPAFGTFTGNHIIRAKPGDQIFVIADEGVYDVSGAIPA
jgi:DNA ligase-associated metallophosphoesterase